MAVMSVEKKQARHLIKPDIVGREDGKCCANDGNGTFNKDGRGKRRMMAIILQPVSLSLPPPPSLFVAANF